MGKMKQLFVEQYEPMDMPILSDFEEGLLREMTVIKKQITIIKKILEECNEK